MNLLNPCSLFSGSLGKILCARVALVAFVAGTFLCGGSGATAQTASLRIFASPTVNGSVSSSLPDDPSVLLVSSSVAEDQASGGSVTVAPKHKKYIPAGEQAQPIDAHDKVVIGVRDLYSPFSLLGIVVTAGYSHVTNGQPNYGTNSHAFAQRVGATALRQTTEGLFTDAIFAPIFHEDPRYYIEGPQYGFFHRAVYAATRSILTRTDNGNATINAALLTGYAASSALSYTYYPQINKNFKDTASTYGGAIGGAAVGFLVSEFAPDVLKKLHINFIQ